MTVYNEWRLKFILFAPEFNARSLLQIQYLNKIQTTARKRI